MEITKFGVQNFRVFKEHFDFELAPIMVLTGPNNSGKSSLSKALLLLKENEESISSHVPYFRDIIYLTGEHNLGSHNNVVNTKNEEVVFSFTFFSKYKFCIEILEDSRIYANYIITNENNELVIWEDSGQYKIDVQNLIEYFKIRLEFEKQFNKTIPNVSFKKIEKLLSALLKFAEKVDTVEINFWDILFENSKNTKEEHERKLKKRIYSGYFDDSYDLGHIDEDDLEKSCYKCLIHIFHRITNINLTKKELFFLIPVAKKSFFAMPKIVYIHTLQESLKRSYSNKDNFELLLKLKKDYSNEKFQNYNGEDEYKYHASKKKPKIKRLNSNQKDQIKTEKDYNPDLGARKKTIIEKWLNEFGIGKELSYGYNEEFDTFFIKIDGKSLLDFGLGFGLIIQILLTLENRENLLNKKEKRINFPPTYIIEEPETGLHPAFQSKMAEMLVDIQKTFNVNLIIETHSEYLIRKLQYLTATNKIGTEDTVIYYFNNPKKVPTGEEQIKKINIEKDGSLTDSFGPGFIDEGTSLKFELMRLNKSRQN
jgi:predicted ATP-dependent endonuclease of OLD family